MSLTRRERSLGAGQTSRVLNRMIERPELGAEIKALSAQRFSALVREIGVEDAGELIALATTEQLVQAFDEDLFVSDRAGERESLDVGRFVVWLEVLIEAGDDLAAARVAELDEDFVAHALSTLVLVIDQDALREQLEACDEDVSRRVDKTLESALTEDLDGYILIARRPDGWDAALALVLALDRDNRALLERLLDRLVRVASGYVEDLDELSTALSEGEALAEEVEALREARRAKQGYVEARAARAFLLLARNSLPRGDSRERERDALTLGYFSGLARRYGGVPINRSHGKYGSLPAVVLRELDDATAKEKSHATGVPEARATVIGRFTEALRELGKSEPAVFEERMAEFSYLANVLMSGHDRDGARLRAAEAADAVIATVCFGAVIELGAKRRRLLRSVTEFAELLRERSADLLFRTASAALTKGAAPKVKTSIESGLLYSVEELDEAMS